MGTGLSGQKLDDPQYLAFHLSHPYHVQWARDDAFYFLPLRKGFK